MCIAIGPTYQTKQGVIASTWGELASSPLRLFGFGALLHSITLGSILLFADSIGPGGLAITIILGICLLLLLGFLMERFPLWSDRSPVIYITYASSSFLITTSLFLFMVSHFFAGYWFAGGLLFIVSGWLLGIVHMLDYRPWLPQRIRIRADLGLFTVTALFLGTLLSLF